MSMRSLEREMNHRAERLMQAMKRIAELETERDALKTELHQWEESDAARSVLEPVFTVEIGRLEEENARLRKALEDAPHDLTCHSVTERHIPGFTHYETDIEDERCPRYHFKCGPCDCWKAALARSPEAKPNE
jgi:hypothetical protein